jgi:hypothetical protein
MACCKNPKIAEYNGETNYNRLPDGTLYHMKDVYIQIYCQNCNARIKLKIGPRCREYAKKLGF